MTNYFDLTGKVALVTGRHRARACDGRPFAELGAAVAINYLRNEAGAEDARAKVPNSVSAQASSAPT